MKTVSKIENHFRNWHSILYNDSDPEVVTFHVRMRVVIKALRSAGNKCLV